jgi:8-oxo-dGTP pyrophosphatase MutT (NUDIX family)
MKIPVHKALFYFLRFFSFPVVWETSVGAVVFRVVRGERFYLLLHYPSGHYDFAKGHVEKGETEEMTLRRETEVESGIKICRCFHRVSIRYFYIARGRAENVCAKRRIVD